MEVHHHPHLEKKHFKEYFLEFLMIFLAVTLGFIAESYREYLGERTKENDYIRSMIEDLKTDSVFLESSINKLIPYHIAWLDSTVHLFQMPDFKGKGRLVYQAFIIGTGWSYNFHPTERTLSQLNSEGFHLIRNKKAANIISLLEDQYKFYLQTTKLIEDLQNDIDLAAYSFADRTVTEEITTIAFRHFSDSSSVQLQLSDIPGSANINTEDKESIKLYIDKLRKYSFYVQYAIKDDYKIVLKEINNAMDILQREYKLR